MYKAIYRTIGLITLFITGRGPSCINDGFEEEFPLNILGIFGVRVSFRRVCG